MKANFHTHCTFCDGKHDPELYIEEALKKGFRALGFSSHVPMPFENSWAMKAGQETAYLKEIGRLKEKYKDRIQIYAGLELDYYDSERRNDFRQLELDYIIGSVHWFTNMEKQQYYSIDGNAEEFRATLNELFKGDMKSFATAYYKQMINMVREFKPDIVGHLDVIKKNNKGETYFSEKDPWYRALVNELLLVIAANGSIVEVNTGGITRGYIDEAYPSQWILVECRKLDIPVVISADAHSAQDIDGCFEYAVSLLKESGYTEQRTLTNGVWISENL
ncbi:MAG: histidinol-phosphatase HisJ [Clostridia bacterium]|nr:histidinol-phosphatase HisJ [Clostridia bacterium]